MSGMKGKLGMLAAMAMMFDSPGFSQGNRKQLDFTPKEAPIPKGCKEYWFNSEGRFYNGDGTRPILKTEVVFHCIAASDKSAKKKLITKPNCIYISALNIQNAAKKFAKQARAGGLIK